MERDAMAEGHVLAVTLIGAEMAAFGALAAWMAISVWRFSRGDKHYGDTARLVILMFSLFIVYRDWRILYVDQSDQAKIVMAIVGIMLAGFTALTAKAYGRGVPLD